MSTFWENSGGNLVDFSSFASTPVAIVEGSFGLDRPGGDRVVVRRVVFWRTKR